jgi:hypothetical protein
MLGFAPLTTNLRSLRFDPHHAKVVLYRRLPVRNEPQHVHVSAPIKTKIRVPLIGFSHSQNNMPFAIANVAVRKLTSNLRSLRFDPNHVKVVL